MDTNSHIKCYVNKVFVCEQNKNQTSKNKQNGHTYDVFVYTNDVTNSCS